MSPDGEPEFDMGEEMYSPAYLGATAKSKLAVMPGVIAAYMGGSLAHANGLSEKVLTAFLAHAPPRGMMQIVDFIGSMLGGGDE